MSNGDLGNPYSTYPLYLPVTTFYRRFLIALAFLTALLLACCPFGFYDFFSQKKSSDLISTGLTSSPSIYREKILRLSIATDPIHLDPALAGDGVSGLVMRMISEGLTRLDDQSLPQPALAHSWQISQGGKEYLFYLRKACWSDGSPLTAHDFVYAWKRMVDPSRAAPNAYLLYPIQGARQIIAGELPIDRLGVEAIDNQTLRIRLDEATPYFLQLLAFDAFFPIAENKRSEHEAKAEKSAPTLCCGPFILKKWKPKNELLFEINPLYWDRERVKMQKIELHVIADSQTALYLFEQGSIDWIGSPLSPLPTEAIEALSNEGTLEAYPASSTYWIHCNLSHPILKEIKARQALSLSIDRVQLAKLLGVQQTAATRLIPPAIAPTQLVETHSSLRFDPELARQLWQESTAANMAQHSDQTPPTELFYIYNTSAMNNFHAKVAQLLQSQWREHLGIDIKLQGIEWGIFLERARQSEFDLARFGWPAQFFDATTFLNIFESREGSYNYSRFDDPLFQLAMETARHTLSLERDQALEQAELRLLDQLPVLPLFFGSHGYMKNAKLKGVVVGPLSRVDFKTAYWELLPGE